MKKVLLLTIVLLSFGCSKKEIELPKEDPKITLTNDTFEYASNVDINEFIHISEGELNEVKMDTYKLGKQTIKVSYNFDGKTYYKDYDINIVDTVSPTIYHSKSYTVKAGNSFNYMDKILCGDNYDDYTTCEISGDYNLEEEGTYHVAFTSTDSSGNTTNSPFTLYVKKSLGNSTSTPTKVNGKPISEFIDKYKNDNTSIGIDVSTWQGNVDYSKVKESGVEFVMIRIGFANSDGVCKLDNQYLNNIKNAKEAGLKVGIYFYSKAKSIELAETQAKWVLDTLNGEELDLPIVFDWECWSNFNEFHISFTKLNLIAQKFKEVVENAGYKGMLYGSATYLERFWDTTNTDVWLAYYTSKNDFEKEYTMWQQSCYGLVPGIDGYVDLNILKK